MEKTYYVYILANTWNTVLYVGVTADLQKRILEHRSKMVSGFTNKYKIDKLVYFEIFNDIYEAITREKQIKSGSRAKKEDLINGINPWWKDLANDL